MPINEWVNEWVTSVGKLALSIFGDPLRNNVELTSKASHQKPPRLGCLSATPIPVVRVASWGTNATPTYNYLQVGELPGTGESPQAEEKRNRGLIWDVVSELETPTATPSKLLLLRGCLVGSNIHTAWSLTTEAHVTGLLASYLMSLSLTFFCWLSTFFFPLPFCRENASLLLCVSLT